MDISVKSKFAQNLIPNNFALIGDVNLMHRLVARDDSTQIGSGPATPSSTSSCDSVTYKAGFALAKNEKGILNVQDL